MEIVKSFKLLGLWCSNSLKWNKHVEEIAKKANKRLFHLRECRRANLPTEFVLTCYFTRNRSVLEYAAPIWGGLPKYLIVENIETRSLRILAPPPDSLQSFEQRRKNLAISEYKKIVDDQTHPCRKYIPDTVTNTYEEGMNSRLFQELTHYFSLQKAILDLL